MNLRHCTLTVAVALLTAAAPGAEKADPLDQVQASSEAWLQTRLEASRLESGWATERTLLESTLAAYQERAVAEEEKRDLSRARTTKDREEIEGLRGKAGAAQEDLRQFNVHLQALDAKLVALRATLPPRLTGGLESAYRTLAEPTTSPGERMQMTVTILTRCLQFDRAITCGEEVLNLEPGQKPRALTVIYWGLSHAYALDALHHQAWLGRPVGGHWTWEAHPDAAPRVADLVAIYQGKADPEFVAVPARVEATAGNPSTPVTP